MLASSSYLGVKYYLENTITIAASGGEYTEAIVGQTRFINPILSQTNDTDADLTRLTFSSLLKTGQDGKLENDLTESYEISEDKLTYTFHIKQDVLWHDGVQLTADDITYTIKTIQNNNYYSPLITNWKGVRAEKVDDYTINFILKNTYSPFLNNLTFGILPQHLWEQISANEFPLSELNFQPVGSGPYKFDSFTKDKNGKILSIGLVANPDYYDHESYIDKITFKFYTSEEDAISAFNRKEVKGINYLSPSNLEKIVEIENKNVYRLSIPRYYAVFFNQTQSKALSDSTVRLALSYAIDKDKIIEDVLKGEGQKIETPIPSQLLGYNPATKIYDFAKEHAQNILTEAGWIDGDGDGIREKGDEKLSFTLVATDWTDIAATATELQAMWKEIGAEVKIETTDNIQEDYIKTRSYQAILFGEILNYDPDPFAFWHSSQKKDPGLNLSLYDNPDVDKILEEARKETDPNVRAQKYQEFQNLVVDSVPAIFLYSPNYIYLQDKSVKDINAQNIITPSDRFNNVEDWYIKTKRVSK
ncbi:MAG: peptide ABC transporter substrate-binding protein [Candidatus Paceibacterota bacterium]